MNSWARCALRGAPVAVRAAWGAVVAGLAVSLTAATMPGLAAQHPAGEAGHARPVAVQQVGTGRWHQGSRWAHISAGFGHSCGIRTGGTLWCWGLNYRGQLGIGSVTDQDLPRQVTIPAAGGWASVTAGSGHTCATRANGTLWCWGENNHGQLGIGNQSDQDLPRQVTTPAPGGWASVTAGDSGHTCATRTGGTVWCWGLDKYGELGIGNDTDQDRPRLVTVPATRGWASVSVGGYHTCALRSGGTLWCWGRNGNGQLGIGYTSESEDRPRQVTSPAAGGWASVSAGGFHTCATRTGGTLWCWGYNSEGALGIGYTSIIEDRPRQVTTPTAGRWATITTGDDHTCAIRTGGTLWCWGDNGYGDLGIGNDSQQSRPRHVTTPAAGGWGSVTAGEFHTCAIRGNGTLWCWGNNFDGQLGIGNHTDRDMPHEVTGCAHRVGQARPARTVRSLTGRRAWPYPARPARTGAERMAPGGPRTTRPAPEGVARARAFPSAGERPARAGPRCQRGGSISRYPSLTGLLRPVHLV